MVSAGHVGGTRGSRIVPSAAHMLWMSLDAFGAWDVRSWWTM